MKVTPIRAGSTWSELTGVDKLHDDDITRIMAFLGATSEDELVNSRWYGWANTDNLDEKYEDVVERLVLVGVDGAGRTLRRERYDSSAEELIDSIDSIFLCEIPLVGGGSLRYCVTDISSGDNKSYVSQRSNALLCRRADFDAVYRKLRIGGYGGSVWRGSHTENADRYVNLKVDEYEFPEGFVNRLIADTVFFLQGEIAARLREWGVPAKRGVLLHGAPGNGKTILTRICAKSALAQGMNVVIIEGKRRSRQSTGGDTMGVGDELRQGAARGPSLLIFEDIDLHCQRRQEPIQQDGKAIQIQAVVREDQALAELLDFLDGVEPTAGYVLLATTNYPEDLDPALRRSGRLDLEVEVSPPTRAQVEAVLRRLIRLGPQPMPDVAAAADYLDGASFADIAETTRRYKILAASGDCGAPADCLVSAAQDLARERGLLTREKLSSLASKAGRD